MNIPYLVWMCCGALIACLFFALSTRKAGLPLSVPCISLFSGIVLTVVCSKALYCITQFHFVAADGLTRSIQDTHPTTWSFFGGAAGVCLAILLSAKVSHAKPLAVLNAFAPAAALMTAISRFGCFFLQNDMTGWGSYMEESWYTFFPVTISNSWGEHYLAAFMLETIIALVIAVLAIVRWKKSTFIRTLFALCLTQIFCESLHGDSLSWLFVRVEQLLCMLVLLGILILYFLRTPKETAKRALPLVLCVVCAVLFVGIEFALDKSNLPKLLLYTVMILGLAVLGYAGHLGFKKSNLNN